MKCCDMYIHVFLLFMCWKFDVNNGQNERPRGVSLTNGPFYSNTEKFTCLDGSLTISKSKVNDDYCDCNDGTDEPGTSACPTGEFHCSNRGYRPIYIPSSRVNDGICDCCDASDEYDSPMRSVCVNTCKELGKADLIAKNEEALVMNDGFEIRKGYIKTGMDTKAERKQTLQTLKEELEQIEQLKDEKEQGKELAEKPEKDAIERHKSAWEEVKLKKQAELDKEKAETTFTELDLDKDGSVTFEEIQHHLELDPDEDNNFTPEEALDLLNKKPEVLEAEFVSDVWKNIKDKYSSVPKTTVTPEVVEPPAPAPITDPPRNDEDNYDDDAAFEEDDYSDDYDEEDFDDEYMEDDEEDDGVVEKYREIRDKEKNKNKPVDEDMPEYDDYTKTLVEIADEARAEFDEISDRMKEMEKNISSLDKQLAVDLGQEEEFLPLQGECFEYTDREYTYKLCAFDKASQSPKSGGSETSLGKWGHWSGSADKKYTEMTYTGGLKCWNGPDRSCVVKLSCGKENKLLSASEPERCVYEFTMKTPALCNLKIDLTSGKLDNHDEL